MKRKALGWALGFTLATGLVVGGCAKKQIREESTAAPTTSGTPMVQAPRGPTPSGDSSINRQEPGTTSTVKSEEPPTGTGAMALAPTTPAAPGTGDTGGPAATAGGTQTLGGSTTPGLGRIYFDFDQAVLSTEARDTLGKNAKYLQGKQGARIRIEGHCDERGTTEYNLALGERRAKAAYLFLMDLGVDPNRMATVSYGEEMPADPGHNEESWAKNRRDEFVELKD